MNHWSESSYECARFIRWLDNGPDGPMDRTTLYAVLSDLEGGVWDKEYRDMCDGYDFDPDRKANDRLAKAEEDADAKEQRELVEQLAATAQMLRAHRAGGGR